MSNLEIVHRYKIGDGTVDVIDYRTIQLGHVNLGFGVGTTVEVRVKGIKTIGGESESADEKRADAAERLEEALRHGEIIVESERDGDEWVAAVYVDGEPLSL